MRIVRHRISFLVNSMGTMDGVALPSEQTAISVSVDEESQLMERRSIFGDGTIDL